MCGGKRIATRLCLLCVLMSAAAARGQEGAPPLAPPADPAGGTAPAVPELPPPTAEAPLRLAPSLPTPRTRPGLGLVDMPAIRPSVPASMADEAAAGPPPLVAPAELGNDAPTSAPGRDAGLLPGLPDGTPGEAPAPLRIDSSRRAPDPLGAVPPGLRPRDDAASEKPADKLRSEPALATPPQRRKLFGLIPYGRPVPSAASTAADDAEDLATHDSESSDRDDPGASRDRATDRTLERRLEAQIRTAAGNHIRSLEVRAAGRKVYVKAQPARFWQKRGLKRTLEGLPALAGYQSRIEVAD